jgi:hypothetical protein
MVDSCETRSTTTRKARLWMVSSRLSATRESGFSASCRTCISLRTVSRTSCAPYSLFETEWDMGFVADVVSSLAISPSVIRTLGLGRTLTLVLTCPPYLIAGVASIFVCA